MKALHAAEDDINFNTTLGLSLCLHAYKIVYTIIILASDDLSLNICYVTAIFIGLPFFLFPSTLFTQGGNSGLRLA